MIVKKNKVIVIDKKDQEKYMKQGWSIAEEVDLDEALSSKDQKAIEDYVSKFMSKMTPDLKAKMEKDPKAAAAVLAKMAMNTEDLDEAKKSALQRLKNFDKSRTAAGKKPIFTDKKKEELDLDEAEAGIKVQAGPDHDGKVKRIQNLAKQLGAKVTNVGKSTDGKMSTIHVKGSMKVVNDLMKLRTEEVDLDEASKEGTVKIIKTKDGKFQIQKMTKGKFVDMGKPYNSQKEAEKFRSGQPDLFGEASARADAMKAMRKGKSVDPADVDNIATDDDVKAASKNIMMQLRKAVSLRSYDVEFADGKQKVNQKIAQAVQNKYNTMRRPADKEKYQNFIAKSYKNMLQSLKAGYHEQKESVLDKVGKIIREKKNG